MDQKGKDTYRHRAAGADAVLAASPGQIALVKSIPKFSLDSLLPYFQDMDIVLVEGFKQEKKPKIEVFRSQINQTPLFPEDDLLVAVVTDSPYSARVPVFQFEDIQADLRRDRKIFRTWTGPMRITQLRLQPFKTSANL